MQRAAGILFCTTDKLVLFLQRGPKGDRAGQWDFPGGGIEGDETAELAAERECREETGWLPEGSRAEWTRQQKDGDANEPHGLGFGEVDRRRDNNGRKRQHQAAGFARP